MQMALNGLVIWICPTAMVPPKQKLMRSPSLPKSRISFQGPFPWAGHQTGRRIWSGEIPGTHDKSKVAR